MAGGRVEGLPRVSLARLDGQRLEVPQSESLAVVAIAVPSSYAGFLPPEAND